MEWFFSLKRKKVALAKASFSSAFFFFAARKGKEGVRIPPPSVLQAVMASLLSSLCHCCHVCPPTPHRAMLCPLWLRESTLSFFFGRVSFFLLVYSCFRPPCSDDRGNVDIIWHCVTKKGLLPKCVGDECSIAHIHVASDRGKDKEKRKKKEKPAKNTKRKNTPHDTRSSYPAKYDRDDKDGTSNSFGRGRGGGILWYTKIKTISTQIRSLRRCPMRRSHSKPSR